MILECCEGPDNNQWLLSYIRKLINQHVSNAILESLQTPGVQKYGVVTGTLCLTGTDPNFERPERYVFLGRHQIKWETDSPVET